MKAADLSPFFEPRSVAVIGASRDPSRVGGSVLANLRAAGFEGRLIPVNPATATVQGIPAAPSLAAVEEPVDLAVIAVPAPAVLQTLRDCVARGVRGAIVISAGFRETAGEGQERETELRAWLRDQPIRVLGPNCLGWIRPARRLNATFAPGMPLPGPIAFVSHSGALAVAILDWARDRHLGFSLFASLGNQADISEADVLRAVADDPETGVIVAYLEGIADGHRFLDALRHAAAAKPVAVLKTGRFEEGARAIASHTGALAGSDAAFDAAVRQAGAARVRTVEELFDLARGLAHQPLPRGKRVLIITNGGGFGIVATDAAREAGLEVGALHPAEREALRAVLPAAASLSNPVDLVGDADARRYANALHAIASGASADALLVTLTAQAATDSASVARAIAAGTRGWRVPVIATFVGGSRVIAGIRTLDEAGIPCYPFPERAVTALRGMATLAERRAAQRRWLPVAVSPEDIARHMVPLRAAGTRRLGMAEIAPLLALYGIGVAAGRLAGSAADAAEAARSMGGPVAIKVASPDILHKSDVGGVILDLASPEAVARETQAMLARVRVARPAARLHGVYVQPMAARGHELLLGMVRDPQFGPLVMVGFGGIYVEVLKDTATGIPPLAEADAVAMLDGLRMAPVLRGMRGELPVDREALVRTICRFAQLVTDLDAFAELELNPVIAGPRGATAVDARGVLREPGP